MAKAGKTFSAAAEGTFLCLKICCVEEKEDDDGNSNTMHWPWLR
jgi:hypothetical protein